ncbi:conserved hypothetical protein [Talaromyces marneffei ATCC 18224]|uniref:Rhodopsin domain-containing protein n=2 Tax=Talaromyces marneffei TaxID=37727 RepID=B6QMD9_TALMQ|nr:conserved hypothetical protein [Talaromyces marneffei ATCC 18224]
MGSRFNYKTNKPAVAVTTFVLLVSVILSVSARLVTKYGLFRKLAHDDLAIIASLLFAILQDIGIALAVDSGYGDHQTDVSDGHSPGLGNCGHLRHCIPMLRAAHMRYLEWPASNIATDLLIIAQIMVLIINIQTSISRRMMFFGIFAPRIFVVITALVELILMRQSTYTNDQTYRMYDLTIISVVIQCVSIVTASWPQLMLFLSWMQSNGLRLNNVQDESSWSYYMTVQSQIQTSSQDRKSRSPRALAPTVRRDQILVTQEWDGQSQLSVARIIREEKDELSHGTMQGSSDRSS